MKKIFRLLSISLFFGLTYIIVGYFSLGKQAISPAVSSEVSTMDESVPYSITEVARGLDVPWAIVFTSPQRILVTERSGSIRAIIDGALQPDPLAVFPDVSSTDEEGLMSLTLDPDYKNNKYLYTSYAYRGTNGMAVKVIRLTDKENSLGEPVTILDHIPAAKYHAGSRLAFGPDGKLYVSTGDATDKKLPQNKNSLAGKILRINTDGTIPDDNPIARSPLWSYGHRNPQGLAWLAGNLYSTEHGPSGGDGPAGGDEVNKIEKGGNYGWPLVSHEKSLEGTIVPLRVFTPAEAPASLMVYSGKMFPQFRDQLFIGALRGQGIIILSATGRGLDLVGKLATQYGRIRDVVEAPDGSIYFSTSNRDGRGALQEGDDKIYRIAVSI